ncbi:hypothetical protein [Methanoculleus sp.]|jgi:hypothetical protein|uniref:hypothetical protein n=1 Tax=Methanoculleus sp. TaxID=90427 RepID=UPI0025FF6C70|nr:hypothetical protein [Methanoculleus sp.]MCK9320048.1 hypothetical protein [Methanoculleus sp.]
MKATITLKSYAEAQIKEQLNTLVILEAQTRVVSKTLSIPEKKEAAMKAITALTEQTKATKDQLKAWEEFYKEIEKEDSK